MTFDIFHLSFPFSDLPIQKPHSCGPARSPK
jgi:hypothetical protein